MSKTPKDILKHLAEALNLFVWKKYNLEQKKTKKLN